MGVITKEDAVNLINGWWIVYFKNKNYISNTPPHYHISVPILDESCLLLCIITSQIQNKELYYARVDQKALSSLVHVCHKDINILTQPSVIDCNNPIYDLRKNISYQQICIESFKIISKATISLSTKKKIIMAIKNSPTVKPIVKDIIKGI